jgi:hypothetical protein
MSRAYDVSRRDGLRWHVMHTKFHAVRHRGSESFMRGYIHRYTYREHDDVISQLLFFKIIKSG